MKISRKSKVESRTLVIPAKQSVREFRLCEERRDEAISILYINNEIASLRSQRRSISFKVDGLESGNLPF
jgi:hypothetical protein